MLVAVLLDAAGAPIATSAGDRERARELAELARELIEGADAASPRPVEHVEVQVPAGSVYAVRSARHVLACVTRRSAQRALVLFELRRAVLALEGRL
jgi:hypothetical protein